MECINGSVTQPCCASFQTDPIVAKTSSSEKEGWLTRFHSWVHPQIHLAQKNSRGSMQEVHTQPQRTLKVRPIGDPPQS